MGFGFLSRAKHERSGQIPHPIDEIRCLLIDEIERIQRCRAQLAQAERIKNNAFVPESPLSVLERQFRQLALWVGHDAATVIRLEHDAEHRRRFPAPGGREGGKMRKVC